MEKVYRLTYADKAATERISHLLNSLRSAPVTLEHSQLQELLTKDTFHLFVAENEEGTITLTSNPSRTAARSLYRSEGFEEYNTGVFRKHL